MAKNANYRKHNDRQMNSSTYHKKDGTPMRSILKREADVEIEEASEPSEPLEFAVRSGEGSCTWSSSGFSDQVGTASRVPRFNVGWSSVTYKGERYQLFGGVRTPYFICLNHPLSES